MKEDEKIKMLEREIELLKQIVELQERIQAAPIRVQPYMQPYVVQPYYEPYRWPYYDSPIYTTPSHRPEPFITTCSTASGGDVSCMTQGSGI